MNDLGVLPLNSTFVPGLLFRQPWPVGFARRVTRDVTTKVSRLHQLLASEISARYSGRHTTSCCRVHLVSHFVCHSLFFFISRRPCLIVYQQTDGPTDRQEESRQISRRKELKNHRNELNSVRVQEMRSFHFDWPTRASTTHSNLLRNSPSLVVGIDCRPPAQHTF